VREQPRLSSFLQEVALPVGDIRLIAAGVSPGTTEDVKNARADARIPAPTRRVYEFQIDCNARPKFLPRISSMSDRLYLRRNKPWVRSKIFLE